ncbi:MAG: ABC transporter ATP-binding protein [Actinobacteria bacterium RBG_16_64_13]|nr:MAG: ABC transporter ATP-binding protein [Actinobacteria bacterium RBG_16_64_13]
MLNLEGVSKAFKGLKAVNSVSTRLEEGKILGLIGPNGAGKTTLFNLITGVYPPTEGKIFFDGKDITSVAPHARCWMGIARTFQLVRPLPELSVLDNAAIGRVYGRDPIRNRSKAEKASYETLEMVGLAARASEKAKSLTLVDRKRLELARALAAKPKLLLLDELLAGLNPSEVLTSMALIQSIRDMGITIIMVEHLVKAVFGIADQIVVLSAGELIAEGTPAEIACNESVIDAYLGRSLHA